MQLVPSPFPAEIDDAFPTAIDPLALSLNENPFPPLPAVRSALIRSICAVNRYPEFLPERLRGLIAGHVGLYLGFGLVLSAIDPQMGVAVQSWQTFVSGGLTALRDPDPSDG